MDGILNILPWVLIVLGVGEIIAAALRYRAWRIVNKARRDLAFLDANSGSNPNIELEYKLILFDMERAKTYMNVSDRFGFLSAYLSRKADGR